jgi:hypothetical protein
MRALAGLATGGPSPHGRRVQQDEPRGDAVHSEVMQAELVRKLEGQPDLALLAACRICSVVT